MPKVKPLQPNPEIELSNDFAKYGGVGGTFTRSLKADLLQQAG